MMTLLVADSSDVQPLLNKSDVHSPVFINVIV